MFSLIITIISIALVAALALATLYYGGSAFNKGADGAEAARLINEGQQVNGAVAINRADAGLDPAAAVTTVAALAPNYLAQIPADLTTSDLATPVTKTVTQGVCDEVNKRAGITTAPADLAAATAGSNVFGCAADKTFFYKL